MINKRETFHPPHDRNDSKVLSGAYDGAGTCKGKGHFEWWLRKHFHQVWHADVGAQLLWVPRRQVYPQPSSQVSATSALTKCSKHSIIEKCLTCVWVCFCSTVISQCSPSVGAPVRCYCPHLAQTWFTFVGTILQRLYAVTLCAGVAMTAMVGVVCAP